MQPLLRTSGTKRKVSSPPIVRPLQMSQHSLGAEYACSLIACLWCHALLYSNGSNMRKEPRIGDNFLLNWLQIGVFLYKSDAFSAFRRAFTSAHKAFTSLEVIRDSMEIASEQNGLCTDDPAVLDRFLSIASKRSGKVEGTPKGTYVTLPEGIQQLFRAARQRHDHRVACMITTGTGSSSCLYVGLVDQEVNEWDIYFADPHWNDPSTAESVMRLDRDACRRIKASAVWLKFDSEASLVEFLLKRYGADRTPSKPADSYTPASSFQITIFVKVPNWDRGLTEDKVLMTGFEKWREDIKRNGLFAPSNI